MQFFQLLGSLSYFRSINMQKFLVFLLLSLGLLLPVSTWAQKTDEQLAGQYLSAGEFRKAADIYEKLLNKNSSSMFLYDNLLNCYLKLKDEEEALRLIKKQSRRYDVNPAYRVDQAWVLEEFGKKEKAAQIRKDLLAEIPSNPSLIAELSLAFQKRGDKSLAIETYLKGRQVLRNNLIFSSELGGLYADLGKTKETVEEYLNVLFEDERQEEQVQGLLQNYLKNAAEYEICRQALLKRIRQHADKIVYQEMLIWLYVQKNDYAGAIPFVKQLERRNRTEGRQLMDLAYLAMANSRFDDAVFVLNEVVAMGTDKPYFALAKQTSLEARAKKLLTGNYQAADLSDLEQEYKLMLKEFGEHEGTAQTIRDLAWLEANYLNKLQESVNHYLFLTGLVRLDKRFLANCKLELAEVYILKGEVWDAMLLFGQVDKDFSEDPLGQEARYRNARLSFYMGEFEWAKAQLDVLKTATTQLISNNAMELSLLIQENMVDSNPEPLRLFSAASLLLNRHLYKDAELRLDSISTLFPGHALSDDILFKKAQIRAGESNFPAAIACLDSLLFKHGQDILADNALFQMAEWTEFKLQDKTAASKLYERLILDYGGSFFVSEARRRYRVLRGDDLNQQESH